MKDAHNTLTTLRRELEFIDGGGYETSVGTRQPVFCMETSAEWKQPLFFEDSPACPKKKYCECSPDSNCVLMGFVPVEHRREVLPCHHIPLNEAGETINSLAKTAGHEKVESALRSWLVQNIEKLDPAAHETPAAKLR